MAYELRDGSGTIFKNKYHEDGDNKPHYRGEVMWRGEKIEVALWVKDGQNGKFFSAKLQEPREKAAQPAPQTMRREEIAPPRRPATSPRPRDELDEDSVPF